MPIVISEHHMDKLRFMVPHLSLLSGSGEYPPEAEQQGFAWEGWETLGFGSLSDGFSRLDQATSTEKDWLQWLSDREPQAWIALMGEVIHGECRRGSYTLIENLPLVEGMEREFVKFSQHVQVPSRTGDLIAITESPMFLEFSVILKSFTDEARRPFPHTEKLKPALSALMYLMNMQARTSET